MEYWENRYRSGKTSGPGSIGLFREWKWFTIDSYVEIQSVNDFGCGDLSFWDDRTCGDYLGIDISPTIIELNRKRRPEWSFLCADLCSKLDVSSKQVVFAMDILFHIMDSKKLELFFENCCVSANKFIFIHNWVRIPPGLKEDNYQRFQNLSEYYGLLNSHGFNLAGIENNPHSGSPNNPVSALYIWRKE